MRASKFSEAQKAFILKQGADGRAKRSLILPAPVSSNGLQREVLNDWVTSWSRRWFLTSSSAPGVTSQEARLVPGSGKSSDAFLSVSYR